MKAMILAAGYGERLWPLTADRTKPALPVLGKPLVGYVAEYLSKFGIKDVVVNLHHQPQSVQRSLGDGSRFGVALQYVYEPAILGTSGALDNARIPEGFRAEIGVSCGRGCGQRSVHSPATASVPGLPDCRPLQGTQTV